MSVVDHLDSESDMEKAIECRTETLLVLLLESVDAQLEHILLCAGGTTRSAILLGLCVLLFSEVDVAGMISDRL